MATRVTRPGRRGGAKFALVRNEGQQQRGGRCVGQPPDLLSHTAAL